MPGGHNEMDCKAKPGLVMNLLIVVSRKLWFWLYQASLPLELCVMMPSEKIQIPSNPSAEAGCSRCESFNLGKNTLKHRRNHQNHRFWLPQVTTERKQQLRHLVYLLSTFWVDFGFCSRQCIKWVLRISYSVGLATGLHWHPYISPYHCAKTGLYMGVSLNGGTP